MKHAIVAAALLCTLAACAKQDASAPQTNSTAVLQTDRIFAGGVQPPDLAFPYPPASRAPSPASGGAQFVAMNCDGCHGGGATGWVGPSLIDGRWRYGGTDAEIFTSIYFGRPKGMPAFGGVLTTDGVWDIVSYLRSLPPPEAVPTQRF
jgi:cytochrome c oxidase cbb3-type subunit 3